MDHLKLFLFLGLIFYTLCKYKESFTNYISSGEDIEANMSTDFLFQDMDSTEIEYHAGPIYGIYDKINNDNYLLTLENIVCFNKKYCIVF